MTEKYIPVEGCWHINGVWGTERPRCPRLEEFIHCQNCDVFHTASLKAYERAIPEEYRQEWTDVLASHKEATASGSRSVIIFRIGDEWVAIATSLCKEISRMMKIHRLPHNRSQTLKGVVNSGGAIRVCFSLGSLLGIAKAGQVFSEGANTIYARMIVMEISGQRYVFPVSEIGGFHDYREAELGTLPNTVLASSASYMKGVIHWNGKSVGCLDESLLASQLERSVR